MRKWVRNTAVSMVERIPYVEKVAGVVLGGAVLRRFYEPEVGAAYGLDRRAKRQMIQRFKAIHEHVRSATHWLDHVVMAQRILMIPPEVQGDLVECGCFKGASTAALSIVAQRVGRRLIACDSFQGLPPDEADARHNYPHLRVTTTYAPGLFAGGLDEVKANIERYGELSVCTFVPGFFSDTLHTLRGTVAFAFVDVDLASSMRDCIRYIWPLLIENGYFYTDDSCDMEVAKLWFDPTFWGELGLVPPGYVGSGCGLPALSVDYSSLGYTVKLASPERAFQTAKFW